MTKKTRKKKTRSNSKPKTAKKTQSTKGSKISQSYIERQSFIDSYDLQNVKRNQSWARLRTQYFIQQGIEEKEVNPLWVSTAKRFEYYRQVDTTIFFAKDSLYIAWFDKSGNVDIDRILPFYDGLSLDEMNHLIDENMQNVNDGKGSSGKAGHTIVIKGNADKIAKVIPFYEMDKGYQTLCFSNKWTLYGLKKILAITTDCSTEASRKEVYEQVKSYVKYNIPALENYF